jgi:hypothetical protein
MEGKVLPTEAVASELNQHFVESRLHADLGPNAEVNKALQFELTQNYALPIYVVYDPVGEKVLGIQEGLALKGAFLEWLQESRAKRG